MQTEPRYFRMRFSQKMVKEPILHHISEKFGACFNILRAEVTESYGNLELALHADADGIEQALGYLRERGVEIEETGAPVNASC